MRKVDKLIIFLCRCHEPGTLWATPGL